MTPKLFRAVDVCEMAQLQPYVLRSWEKEFPGIGVQKSPESPRLYRQSDIDQVQKIKQLVFGEGLTLAGARRRLEVFNLHLGLSARERVRQVGLLARSRELASLGPDVACLVAGDFNDWRQRLVPLLADDLRFRSASERASGGALATYPAFFPRAPLDWIYYRGPLRLLSARRCRLRLSRVASDHLPVVADFELD